jgi:selenoprotein W-related protein
LTSRLLNTFKQQLDRMTLVPSGGGCFELTLDGELAYSKLQTGKFPDEEQMVDLVRKRLAAPKKKAGTARHS